MGCISSKPMVSHQESYYEPPVNPADRNRNQAHSSTGSSHTYADWQGQPQYPDRHYQEFEAVGETPIRWESRELGYSQGIDRTLQSSEVRSNKARSAERINYISNLSDAVKRSKNRICFANPNALVQFMNKTGFGNVGESSSGTRFSEVKVRPDFKNDELFSGYSGDAWIVREGLDVNDLINNHLFGKKESGTAYYFDCAEYVQLLQLYAVYNSISPEERQDRFHGGEGFYIGSFQSTGIENRVLLGKESPSADFSIKATGERFEFDEAFLFNQLPVGSRIAFTNTSSSANFTNFKNENTVKISNKKVSALGLGEERLFTVNELKYRVASADPVLTERISDEQARYFERGSDAFNEAVKKALIKKVFISEVAVFNTPLSKDFDLYELGE